MRKLTEPQHRAVMWLALVGSYCPDPDGTDAAAQLAAMFDDLVKKHFACVEPTDGGPRYTLSTQGVIYAARS